MEDIEGDEGVLPIPPPVPARNTGYGRRSVGPMRVFIVVAQVGAMWSGLFPGDVAPEPLVIGAVLAYSWCMSLPDSVASDEATHAMRENAQSCFGRLGLLRGYIEHPVQSVIKLHNPLPFTGQEPPELDQCI